MFLEILNLKWKKERSKILNFKYKSLIETWGFFYTLNSLPYFIFWYFADIIQTKMRRVVSILCFLFYGGLLYSQDGLSFEEYLNNGKQEYDKSFEDQDFARAVENLEKAVELRPDDSEAHYYLGYSYSRLNSKDGSQIPNMKRSITEKSSKHLEKTNELSPKYEGQMMALDPYTKITSEWGSLAISYYYKGQLDSAKWAFGQGKERGGFSSYGLELNKAVLDLCSPSSILVSSGDYYTINLWYLQIQEGYRTDVSVVDVSLLNTIWYANMLQGKEIADFGMERAALEEVAHQKWSDSLIRIDNLTWVMKPSYEGKYILRSDRLFLEMLSVNSFDREVFLTNSIREESKLSLDYHLTPWVMLERIDQERREMPEKTYKKNISDFLALSKKANTNSYSDLYMIDAVRSVTLKRALELIEVGQNNDAQELVDIVEKYSPKEKYPYQNENTSMLLQSIKDRLDEN